MNSNFAILNTEPGRRRAVDVALDLTHNTPIVPQEYERVLLEAFVQGVLSLDQVIAHLEDIEH
jgi:hypothetical protein